MSRRKIKAGTQNLAVPIFVQDTSSTTGGGLGSLVYNTSGLAARYRRQGQSSWTSITLASMTLGTWVSGGFVSAGGVTGKYEFCPPNAAIAAGVEWVEIELYGAANMFPVLLEFELDTLNYQATGGKIPATIAAGDVATDAIDAASIKADAVTKVQTGLPTAAGIDAQLSGTHGAGAWGADAEAIAADLIAAVDDTGLKASSFTPEALDQLRAAEIDLSQWDPDTDPVKIYRGVDHLHATGNAFTFRNVAGNWPDLTGCTIRMELIIDGVTAIAGSGTIVTASGANQEFYIQVLRTAFDGSLIKDKTGVFRCVRIDGSGNRFPLANGVATLFPNTAPAA